MSFRSLYRHGFARVAACTIDSHLADPAANVRAILDEARLCDDAGAVLAVFPELCVSGYAIDDLLMQDVVLDAVEHALLTLAEASRDLLPILLVGAPLRVGSRLFNTAVAIHRGSILGVVPKMHLPNYREFYEKRHFASGAGMEGRTIALGGDDDIPFGTDIIFEAEDLPGFALHVEICEDVWVPVPPSSHGALAGATVLANLSASNITIGKADTRTLLSASQSARCLAAYLYAAAGAGESTTDVAWDGQASIFELGETLAETDRFPLAAQRAMADIDLDRLRQERLRMGSFDDNGRAIGLDADDFRRVMLRLDPPETDLGLKRPLQRFPFVPSDPARLHQDCYEGYNIQIAGLVQRLRGIGGKKMVIGVSGGLDSTHALIVAARAADRLGLPRSNILAYTLPGFATSDETRANAIRLMESLEVTWRELDIRPAARQMLADMEHPFGRGEPVYDVTFENVQAGLRTDYLFRLANQNDAIVIGTGDLSELALGWCTYGVGDQMSHYNVNGGIPENAHPAPHSLGHQLGPVRRGCRRHAERHPRHRDFAGAGARRRGREAAEHRGQDRPLRAAGFHPVPRTALRLPPLEDRLSGDDGVGGCGPRRLAARLPRGPAPDLRPPRDQALDGRLPAPLLCLQPVQALGHAERPEGQRRRQPLAPRRLAGALRQQCRRLAARTGDRSA